MASLPTLLVAACAAWHPGAVGHYDGTVDSKDTQAAEAWITEDPDGRLSGRYVLHETARDVPGTLHPVADAGCGEAWFRWEDLYGTGTLRLRFQPGAHCFEGVWGAGAASPTHPWLTCSHATS